MTLAALCCSLSFVLASASHSGAQDELMSKYKAEIEKAERDFAQMAQTHSVRGAFLAFAAPEAVLLRGDNLFRGRNEIAEYFDQQTLKEFHLNWKPSFVDVSKAGDLGYTYGKFTLTGIDADGKEVKKEGVFHTVWKRQADGKWKYVWD